VFTTDPAHTRARNRDAFVQACRDVASATSQAIAAGRIPVLVGADCSITAGAVAGCLAQRPDTGLVYLDGDAHLRTPQTAIAGKTDRPLPNGGCDAPVLGDKHIRLRPNLSSSAKPERRPGRGSPARLTVAA
jgi:Arginase family